jgi:PEP-CTERM motif
MMTRSSFRSLFLAAAVTGAALAGSAAHAAELLTDGGFEAPAIGGGNYTYPGLSDGTITPIGAVQGGWTFGSAAIVGATGSNAWYGGAAPAGQEGDQFAALQQLSTLSQTFTMIGSTLDLSWLAAGRPNMGCCNGDQTYEVKLNGDLLGTFSTFSGQAFTAQSLVVGGLTNGGSYTLSFQGQANNDETSFIDRVSATGAVPEPAAWGLMILGFGGVGAALRGKRRGVAVTA